MSNVSSPKPKKLEKIKHAESVYMDTGYPVPETYNEDRLVILPRDPRWIFVYWDISDKTKKSTKNKYGTNIFEESQFVLRLHDVTETGEFSEKTSRGYKEIAVHNNARSWYVDVENPNRKYCVQLGIKTKDGRFISLLISNVVMMPAGRVSDVIDEQWMLIFEDYEKLLKLSGIDQIAAGSLDITRLLAKRWEFLGLVSSGAFSSITSRGFKAPPAKLGKPRKFWLIADAELIVYGATDPAASLKINDKTVKLNPDGTFSIRVDFPDCKKKFAIKAASADKVEQRKITITAERKTK